MTATEDFFKKKMAGQTTGSTSGGSATDEFFKKKIAEKSAVTTDANITTPPEDTTSPGDLSVKMEDIQKPLISAVKQPSISDTAYSGQGTTSMGQGVKIDQTPYKMERQKEQAKSDEELRIKQEDLVMGAQQLGHLFVDKLSPEDKDILIAGLKNKEASLAYKGQAQKMSELVGESISPKLTQAGPNDTIDASLSPDPRDPENFAFYEKQKRNFDMVAPDGTKIKAYNKTAVDDPVENINVALGMGRDQVMGTIGAIGEWMGVSDGTFRKQAENSQKWGELDFNTPLDDENASVFDSRFWTQKVPQSIPFMIALAPAGIVGAGVGSELAAVAGLGQLGTFLSTAGFAGISSRMAESMAEGAGVYAELKDNGVEDAKASQEAFDTAKQNLWMVFSDMGQMAATFAPVKKIPGLQSLLGKVLVPTAKFAFDATSEGGEEVFQGYVQQLNTAQGLGKKPLSILEYLNSDEARETFKLGAATGLMFGSVGVAKDAYDNFIDRAKAQVDMVDEAIQKNDIDFIPKMEILAEKDAISRDTVDAVKTLLDMNLKNEGSSYEEWMTNGLQARKEKIDETRGKIQEFNNTVKEKETEQKQTTYRERLKESGMDNAEIEKTLTIEKAFGLDIPQSEFINEFVTKEIGRNFTYNTDLAGKYSPQVETAIKTAKENYKNLEIIQQDVKTAQQTEFKVEGVTKITEAQKERVKGDLEDTKRLLAKELAYSPEFQNLETIDRYTKHITKLENIVSSGEYTPTINGEEPKSGPDIDVGTKPTDLTTTPEVSSTPEKSDNSKYQMEDISEKAFVVKGETMAIKEQLKEAGGKWIPKYKGWMFSKKRREQVNAIIGQQTTKEDNIQNITTNPTQNDNINTRQVPSEGDRTSQEGANTEGVMGRGDTSDTQSGDGSRGETPTSNGGKRLGKKGRAEINEKAKAILESKKYSTDRGEYTQEDIQVLEEYSGAGGKEEAGATGRGLLDEYYTPKKIVDAMWSIADFANPRAKKVLEPTAGVGRFIQGRTDQYEISGMEIDKVSGTIAQILNPDAKMRIGDFQKLFIDDKGKQFKPTEKYDIIIGNPPYGARAGLLKGLGEESKISRQEEYFMKRGVDLLNDQGALIFIIPSSFLNNGRSFAKEQIVANGGELVAAYRLPEGMFEDTTIGTDIVVIKKTGQGHVGDMIDNTYFAENPGNILGEIQTRKNKYGRMEDFVSGDKEDVANLLETIGKDYAELADAKKFEIEGQEYEQKMLKESVGNQYDTNLIKAFNAIENVKNKVVKQEVLDTYDSIELNAKKNKLFQSFTDAAMEHIGSMYQDAVSEMSVQELYYEMVDAKGPNRSALNYEKKQKKTRKQNVKSEVQQIETVIPEKTIEKNKESIKKTAKPREVVSDVGGVPTIDKQILNDWSATQEELDIFANTIQDGSVPFREEWAQYLNFYKGEYFHDINYFSGDVREKLDQLEIDKKLISDEQYNLQRAGLERVLPKNKTVQDISFDPLDRFISEFPTGKEKTVWSYKNGRRDWEYVQEQVKDIFFDYLHEVPRGLLRNEVQKGDIINYVNGDRARSDTKRIMGYIKSESKRLFNEFIKTTLDFELQTQIAEKYNKEKNAYVRPRYDRIPVSIEGMAEEFRGKKFHLSETQKTGVGFLVNKGSGLIAYGVGVGKTHTLAVATMANMQKGWAKRPLFIVPGSTLEKTWIKTIEGTFPGVKINNLGGLQAPIVRQLQKERGEDYTTWIKDGEISIITHDGILKLGFKADELFELTRDLNDALGNFDSNLTEREREKNRDKIQEELGKALRGQSEVSFTDLGFDHISVDEVHNFRKVFQGAKTEVDEKGEKRTGGKRFANVIGGQPSTRARKLFLLSQAVQKKSGGRNVFLASATPFENHATEVYNILSFMARERLKQMGIFNINDFFSAYANFQTEIIQKADGSFENKEVMKSFGNIQELQRLIQEFIDFKEDPTLVRPDKVVLTPQLKMSPKQAEVKQKILEMLASDDDGVVLKATTYAKSNSTSPFFVKEFMDAPTSLDDFIENSPKIKYTLEMIKELKSNPKTEKKGSFIYIGKEGVNFTDYYVKYLTERVGYKSSEIGVITGEISIDDREAIKDKFNNGVIKVLIGGDPTKEGIDLQDNGYATFNVALGWNPTEMAQVEGRVWRQGNRANKVLMVYPLVENSGDVNIYQKFEEKAGRINDLFSYSEGKTIFDVGEVDPKEKKLMLLTDPVQKANLSIIIDSEKINSDLIYNRGTLEDMKKMKSEFAANETAINDLSKRIENVTDENRKKELTTELKKYKTKNEGIQKKLKAKDIKDFDSEIARIEKNVEQLTDDLAKTKLTFEELLTKFTKEETENTKKTKTIENHRSDIKTEIDKLYFKSEEELRIEKETKIAEADAVLEEKRKFQDETSDSWIYDLVGEKYGVKAFAKEKIDLQDAYIEAVRLAPAGWNVRVEDPTADNYLENVVAYADLATKEIVISSTEARKSTAAHEVVHASLSELPEAQRKIIIETARKQWETETQRKLTDEQAEEFLAEEFKYYMESQKWKTKTLFGRLKEFLSKLWNTIKGVFGKDNKVKTFYEDILAGKIVQAETRVGKKFQSISDKELYDEIDAENFGYKIPPKLGLAYQKYEKEKIPSKELTSLKEFGRRTFTPLDTTIGNISLKLKQRLAKFEYGVMNGPIIQEARPVMQRLFDKIKDKKQTDEYRILDIALKNGDAEVVNHYAEKLGIVEELKESRKILDAIYRESADVGIDMKYLEEYFPRTVNDSIGLLSYMYGTEYGSQIKEAIKLSEIQVGHDLTDDEKAVIANKMLRGYKIAGVTLTPPGNVKARSIEEVTKELNPFYNDSMDSLAIYIQGMNENIEARKLFGKGENLSNSIGAFTMELLANGEITPVEEIQLTKAIQARFASSPMDAWVQAYRGISYLTTMGSVVSAITQIQDLSFSLYENGFMRTGSSWIQAITGNSKISKADLGVSSIIQEFKEQSKIQDAVTKVFKMVGLEWMDKIGKETFVNAYYKTLQNEVRRGDLSGLEALEDTKGQAAQDLIDGKVTEDIKYILFARLCDFQPLTRSQMPEYYNTSGNMKVVYMLKTYMIKQIDVFRREAFHEIYQGSKRDGDRKRVVKGIKNLMFLVISLALMGAGTDVLKNLLLNRPFSFSDLVVDNILKIMGFSKYTIYKVKEDSVSAGLLSLVVPPFNFFNDVIADIGDAVDGKLDNPMEAQSINNIPVAGKLYYWWFGKGAIKSEKKREKEAKAGMPKVSTKKVSPFSETNGFKTQNGFKDKLYFK